MDLTTQQFDAWLRGYKAAWESRDPQAAAALFTADAEYYWTPFDPPHRGHSAIAAAWQGAVSQQKDVHFSYTVLAVDGARGIAHWHTRFNAIASGAAMQLDGIMAVELASPSQCRLFREWWHLKGGS